MKKISILSIASIIFIAGAIISLKFGNQLAASALGVMAYFSALFAGKQETRQWQLFLLPIIAIAAGYVMSPRENFYFIPASLLCASLIVALRLILFERIGHIRSSMIEPLLFLSAVAFYVLANMQSGSTWMTWTFPALPIAWGAFVTFGHISDSSTFNKIMKDRYGVTVGKSAPVFTLPDQDGNAVCLSDFKNKRHVLLVFVRGDWCPTCHIMLRTYERNKEKFAEKNIMLMAIGPDPVGVNRDMVLRLGLDYKMLSDEKGEAAKAFGMMLQGNNPITKYAEGIPLPAAFLIDSSGRLVYSTNPRNVGEILSPETIFPVVEKLEVA